MYYLHAAVITVYISSKLNYVFRYSIVNYVYNCEEDLFTIRTCTPTYTYIHSHTHTHIRIHIHTHAYIYIYTGSVAVFTGCLIVGLKQR